MAITYGNFIIAEMLGTFLALLDLQLFWDPRDSDWDPRGSAGSDFGHMYDQLSQFRALHSQFDTHLGHGGAGRVATFGCRHIQLHSPGCRVCHV